MKVQESKELTKQLLKKFDLAIYEAEIFLPNDNMIIDNKITTNTIAYCDSSKFKIRLSIVYVLALSKKRIYNIIIHEIAHALDVRKNGNHCQGSHGFTWQLIAASIGAEPKPCLSLTIFESLKVDFFKFVCRFGLFC